MRPQPLICVIDVPRSSRFSHSFEVDHHHGAIGDVSSRPSGNGLALWFEVGDVDDAVRRTASSGCAIRTATSWC